jgi:DUF4097 and DUF4098 domain-containing protein YvlB
MSEEKEEIHYDTQSGENDLISLIEKSLKDTERRFEEYLTADRADVLNNILSSMHSTDSTVTYDKKIHELLGIKIKEIEGKITYFSIIQAQIKDSNFYSIYHCYMDSLGKNNKEICKNYLNGFLEIIKILIDFMIHENALHFLRLKRFGDERPLCVNIAETPTL